jgi:polyisoprenoid-binding protein YceI
MKTWMKWAIGAVVLVILAVTAGPFIYIHWIKDDAPSAFTLAPVDSVATDATTAAPTDTSAAGTTATDSTTPAATTGDTTAATTGDSGSGVDGTWNIGTGSEVGYRVTEVLFGQDTEGVGRTSSITGSIDIAGAQVTTGSFEVDMATVTSDESRRDGQFNGRLLQTDEFPTATFTLTAPIELGSVPAEGQQITATATGDLTLHGVTKSVTFDVQAQLAGGQIQIVGSTDIVFADYSIEQPDTGGITTQDHGLLEFSLFLSKG